MGRCIAGMDVCFACCNKGHKNRDCHNIKSRWIEVHQAPLDHNAPKKNPSYGMGARKENSSRFDSPSKS